MRCTSIRVFALLLLLALMTACGTTPQQPDQDTLDRRDDAMEDLERNI
ncbi:MAG: hypothetical protein WED11_07345 [Natronospirillum sp.]